MSYEPLDLCGPYRTVFDVGAFRGDFARACLKEWMSPENVVRVHSFEPLEPAPAEVTTFSRYWAWHPVAVGNECEIVTMFRNEFVPSSSLLPMAELHMRAFPYTERAEEVRVGMVTLDELVEEIVEPALLKIDVQGFELEVLKGADTLALGHFSAVVLEVSHAELYRGAPTPEELAEFLSERGFEHKRTVDRLYHPRVADMLLQSDELWVRP